MNKHTQNDPNTCAYFSVQLNDPDNPSVLIEGVLFRARYLGSTQLISEGQPSKAMRMMQAQEAVGRIKVLLCICAASQCSDILLTCSLLRENDSVDGLSCYPYLP